MNILLIEDDMALADALRQALAARDLVVNVVAGGKAGVSAIRTEPPDVVILDLGLPDLDGIEVLKRIREYNRELPVLLLTARDSLEDKIAGLDSGGDDYLTKPFEIEELLARLRVLERRLSTAKSNVIAVDNVSLDIARGLVTVDGNAVELPRREFMLLRVLMENAGRVLTRASLESRLYSWGEEVASNTIEVHIHHLRRKLGTEFIRTVRGVGYRIAPR